MMLASALVRIASRVGARTLSGVRSSRARLRTNSIAVSRQIRKCLAMAKIGAPAARLAEQARGMARGIQRSDSQKLTRPVGRKPAPLRRALISKLLGVV